MWKVSMEHDLTLKLFRSSKSPQTKLLKDYNVKMFKVLPFFLQIYVGSGKNEKSIEASGQRLVICSRLPLTLLATSFFKVVTFHALVHLRLFSVSFLCYFLFWSLYTHVVRCLSRCVNLHWGFQQKHTGLASCECGGCGLRECLTHYFCYYVKGHMREPCGDVLCGKIMTRPESVRTLYNT